IRRASHQAMVCHASRVFVFRAKNGISLSLRRKLSKIFFRTTAVVTLIVGRFCASQGKAVRARSSVAGRERPGAVPAHFSSGWPAAPQDLCFLPGAPAAWSHPAVFCWHPHHGTF